MRSDFQKTLDFPNRPIRPNPQVFDCWPNCEEDTFYFRRDPNEEFKCVDKKGKQFGKKVDMKTKDLLNWIDDCHAAGPHHKVTYSA